MKVARTSYSFSKHTIQIFRWYLTINSPFSICRATHLSIVSNFFISLLNYTKINPMNKKKFEAKIQIYSLLNLAWFVQTILHATSGFSMFAKQRMGDKFKVEFYCVQITYNWLKTNDSLNFFLFWIPLVEHRIHTWNEHELEFIACVSLFKMKRWKIQFIYIYRW